MLSWQPGTSFFNYEMYCKTLTKGIQSFQVQETKYYQFHDSLPATNDSNWICWINIIMYFVKPEYRPLQYIYWGRGGLLVGEMAEWPIFSWRNMEQKSCFRNRRNTGHSFKYSPTRRYKVIDIWQPRIFGLNKFIILQIQLYPCIKTTLKQSIF